MIPRTFAPLPERTEQAISAVIDAAMLVHQELGPGLVEVAYRNAVSVELQARAVPFTVEKAIVVKYRGQPVALQRLDLIVDDAVIVELKAVEALSPLHQAQLMSYMRAAGIRAGLLMNVGGVTLKQGLRRIVI